MVVVDNSNSTNTPALQDGHSHNQPRQQRQPHYERYQDQPHRGDDRMKSSSSTSRHFDHGQQATTNTAPGVSQEGEYRGGGRRGRGGRGGRRARGRGPSYRQHNKDDEDGDALHVTAANSSNSHTNVGNQATHNTKTSENNNPTNSAYQHSHHHHGNPMEQYHNATEYIPMNYEQMAPPYVYNPMLAMMPQPQVPMMYVPGGIPMYYGADMYYPTMAPMQIPYPTYYPPTVPTATAAPSTPPPRLPVRERRPIEIVSPDAARVAPTATATPVTDSIAQAPNTGDAASSEVKQKRKGFLETNG